MNKIIKTIKNKYKANRDLYSTILFFSLLIIFTQGIRYRAYRHLEKYGAYTVGRVYDFWKDGRSNPVTCFEYYYQGVRYTGSSAVVINDGKKGKGNKYLINFSTKDPKRTTNPFGLRYKLPDSLELGTLIVYDFERKKIVNIDTTHVVREKLN